MKIVKTGIAGTLESSDVLVTVSPSVESGLSIDVDSVVQKQFGKQILEVVRKLLEGLNISDACVTLQDKGALDCTIRARVEAAAYRAAGITQLQWRK